MALASQNHTSKYTQKTQPWLQKMGVGLLLASLCVSLLPRSAQAATVAWQGQETVRSHQSITLKPGSAMTFEIKFKNTGTQTWRNDTANFVALATVDPEKHRSPLQHTFWNEYFRPAKLLETSVKPGAVGTFRFALQAPKTEGSYKETFQAVAKNTAWIEGTKFNLTVVVSNATPTKPPVATTPSVGIDPSLNDYPVRDGTAYAASWPNGQIIRVSATPGQVIPVKIEAKNAGTVSWKNSGARFVSLYTVRPNYRSSLLFTTGAAGWKAKDQIALKNTSVAPGLNGSFEFSIKAPATAGTYAENFRLSAEEYSWAKNGEVQLIVTVASSADVPVADNGSGTSVSDPTASKGLYRDTTYEATYLVSSHRELDLRPGEQVTVQFGFKNIGQKTWVKTGNRFVSLYTIEPNYRVSRFATVNTSSGWLANNQVAMSQAEVLPGQIGYFKFVISAPSTPGMYVEKFRLAAEDLTWIKGGELELPILVRLPDGSVPNDHKPGDTGAPNELGPIMRVGLYASDDPFIVTADSPFEVRTGTGELLVSLPARSPVTVTYDRSIKQYGVTALGVDRLQTTHVVMQALDNSTIMTILSLNKPVPWNPAVNENTFRGSIEIRHSDVTDKTWAINILPMEHYLRGIAETSSNSPVEFLKVMTISARTFGYYHFQRQTKHADENFFVDSVYDQVYRGYSLEQRHPSLTQAVQETAGEVVTYTSPETGEMKIAITPYFSWSDGRTRSWSEVWGGDVPWAKSVPVPKDQGKTLYGHGVGLSARGGLLMIEEDGMTYKQVLHYFFQGIEIQDWY